MTGGTETDTGDGERGGGRRGLAARPVARLLGLCLVAGLILAGVTFPLVGGLGLISNDASDTVSATSSDLAAGQLPLVTTVTDRQGAPIAYLYDQNRQNTPLEQISPTMRAAIVAIEDRRFYEHDGVDWTGTLRALVTNQSAGSTQQGASTLTQQYIKNYQLYVTARSASERLKATEATYARKLREVRVALQLERQLAEGTSKRQAKDEILQRYLNIVFLGNNSYGVGAAARTYFNTTPDRLTIAQAAMLAGMVQSTAQFDPVAHPQAATGRRNEVINQMRLQGMITPQQAQEATASPLGVSSAAPPANGCIGAGDAAFFCKYVVDYLDQAGLSAEQLNRGGYTIRTTLDRPALTAMTAALRNEVPAQQRNVADVMASVAPGQDRHEVVAMGSNRVFGVDGAALETSYGLPWEPVNLGAGSVYKVFTAATALDKGLGIDYQMQIPPDGYASPIYRDGQGNPFPVRNAGNYAPVLSMTDALAQSPNTGFVKLMEYTGVAPVVDMAVKLGMRSLAEPQGNGGKSIAEIAKEQNQGSFTLGVTPTSVLELSNVGATLASRGKWCPPTPIVGITDPAGAPVPVSEQPCEQVVPPTLADTLMTGMSKDDQPGGTSAAAAGENGWTRPMSGKTGTTQQNKSAAFLGFTPGIAGAVITFDDSSSPRPLCDGGGDSPPYACSDGNIFGGKTPARTWYKAMNPVVAATPVQPLPATDPRYVQGGTNEQIPEVTGQQVDAAEQTLREAGFTVVRSTVGNRAPAGTVVGQSPRGSALPDQAITLQVASGTVSAPPPPPGAVAAPAIGPAPGG
ncbi:transglycosylase/D,D-transpeptidase PonA2 [Actinomycetospora corticicola]|uniref:Membrane peptidoglycan carboxypeptidase n=1 Tax=Actinomycetospora corticicola TaxID=663602 RepID=A0A7Y9E018_9PSEU|nr:transglycosylase domain-containing protein [Actinomycetospora corticicola]NYD38669.1 membrane peptidoglycan carboxypeptidase [Actinomycetospora corticicola]